MGIYQFQYRCETELGGSVTICENGYKLKNRLEAKDTSVYVDCKMVIQYLINPVLGSLLHCKLMKV